MKETLRKHGHNHKNGPWCHRFWDGLCNQIEQHNLWSICHRPIACDCCVSFWNASLSQQDHPERGMDHGAGSLVLGTRKRVSSPLDSLSLATSMAPCAFAGASGGSGLSEIPGCRSRTHSDPIPIVFLVTEKPLLHLDLSQSISHKTIKI